MDARALVGGFLVGLLVAAAPAHAQTPTPTPTAQAGPPKILLAFDASGSMATDSGNGESKIKAAQDAAVALLDTLPATTQVGLRIFGGNLPSRPIAAACKDSKLVLPIGALDRAQAETQIRSFHARGRTPIAYALQQAADDLGDSGPRTIVLVSDGKDTCQPPAPCDVAQKISQGGVIMRIQAIGFNVDPDARKELQCIANAGGGIYRDADNAGDLKEELRTLSTRSLREYIPRGKPITGGTGVHSALPIQPGQYTDKLLPDSERWYAVDLRLGETLKASMAVIPPTRDISEDASSASASMDIVTPSLDIPDRQNSSAGENPFERRGFTDGIGVVSRPIGVGAQADPDEPFHAPGRYYLKIKLEDTSDKALYNATGGQPYTIELAMQVLGRNGPAPKPAPTPKPAKLPAATADVQEPPSSILLTLVGGGLAALGFAGGAAALWRRRA